MDEEKIVVSGSEVETVGDVELYSQETIVTEFNKEINAESSDTMVIDVSEVTGVVVGDGSSSAHTHQIADINTLEDKLTTLASPHEVYSPNGGYAEFRAWTKNDKSYYQTQIANSGDPSATGYFVGLVNEDENPLTAGNICIDICQAGVIDVYGVVASKSSAFCGYQYPDYNLLDSDSKDKSDANEPYAKVCLLGDVAVRVHDVTNYNQITIGDFVVPDEYGCAKKSNIGIGYKVISKGQAGLNTSEYRWYYVVITLVPQNDNVSRVMAELESTRQNLGNMTIQIGKLEGDINNISGVTGVVENLEKEFEGLQGSVDKQISAAEEANKIAKEAADNAQAAIQGMQANYVAALGAANNAQTAVSGALTDIKEIREDMTVLDQYGDTIVGYFAGADANGGKFATLVENIENITSIQQQVNDDGGTIRFLIAHADLYSVGSYSVTYGLSYKESQNVLKEGGFIYIPTETHTEESYIYECIPTSVEADVKTYCKIGDMIYSFVSETNLGNNDVLIYDSRMHKLTINDEEATVTPEDVETYSLEFKSEKTFEFEQYKVYKWTEIGPASEDYWWVEQKDAKISYDNEEPENKDNEYELWYCGAGILGETYNYEYTPGTLYRWNGTRWVVVATINDSNARSTSLFRLTEEFIASTITDLDGNLSEIKQTATEISSQVSDIDGELSVIKQNADSIVAGTYNGEGDSAELAILLNRISNTISNTSNVLVGEFLGEPSNLPEGTAKYSVPPTWNGTAFEYAEDVTPDVDGEYCLNPGNPEQYYKLGNGKYEVYIMGAQTITAIQEKVSDNSAEISSLTEWKGKTDTTLTAVQEKSDENGAQITSIAAMQNVIRTETVITDTLPSGTRYSALPIWDGEQFSCVFENTEGDYLIPSGGGCYYKLFFTDDKLESYEKYEHVSSSFTSIQQKVNDNESYISAVVTNGKADAELIIKAINDDSTVSISADKIDLNGYVTVTSLADNSTTTINGAYISSGIIQSNNYQGPKTYVMYGVSLDKENMKIVNSTESSDYIYYTTIEEGTLSSSFEEQIYYYVTKIEVDEPLFADKQDTSVCVVSEYDFDLIPKDEVTGMKFDLNNGTVYSKNLMFGRDGNLAIFVTSGYIGEKGGDNGFLIAKNYDQEYYSLSYQQNSYTGNKNPDGAGLSGDPGVYIGPDGIGLGNGYFYVDNRGNLTTEGSITMYGKVKDDEGNEYVKPVVSLSGGNLKLQENITLDGNITLAGNITWNSSSNPVRVKYSVSGTNEEAWDDEYNSQYYYAHYSYDGGETWTAIKVQGKDGEPGENGAAGLDEDDVFNFLTNEGTNKGLFPFSTDPDEFDTSNVKLYINADYIRTGTLSGVTLESNNNNKTYPRIVRISDGFIKITPSDTDNAKMVIGMDSSSKHNYPYILFGQGTNDTLSATYNGLPVVASTGLIYKDASMFKIGFTDSENNQHGIFFYDNIREILSHMQITSTLTDFTGGTVDFNSDVKFSGATEVLGGITFKNTMDFSGAKITGLNITFG